MDNITGMGVGLIVLIILSAFFSASETAYASVNKIRLKNYADEGNKRAKTALYIAENFDNALSTILIGNNVVNITATSMATILFTNLFGASGAAIATVVMTIIVLIFGEILPKSYAKQNSEKIALWESSILLLLMKLSSPIVWVFIKIKTIFTSSKSSETVPSMTEQELKYIIETIEEEGVLHEQESELIQSALAFDEITVQEILIPRVDMVAFSVDQDVEEIKERIIREKFSRIPVYEKSIDKIIGTLGARTFFENIITNKNLSIKEMLIDCLFVHKTMRISALLSEFKRRKLHIAIVKDDFGGTMGMVTMEDILEQLVGDIWDEHDEVIHEICKISDTMFEVSGDANIYEMFAYIGIEDRTFDSDYNTLSGWAFEVLEHIPQVGENFAYKNLSLTIMQMEDNRIIKLLVEKSSELDEENTINL